MVAVGEQLVQQVELGTGKTDGLTIDSYGSAIYIHLQTVIVLIAFAQTCLNHIHHVIAQLFAVGHNVGIYCTQRVTIGMAVDIAKGLGLDAVAHGVDVGLDIP